MEPAKGEVTSQVANSLQTWLQIDAARLLADRKGRVVWLNAAAQSLVADSEAVSVMDGVLTSTGDPGPSRLPDLLSGLADTIHPFVAFGRNREANVLICGRTIHADGRILCGLNMRVVGDGPALSGPLLRQVFGLTGAEQAIVLAMMAGQTAEIITRNGNQSIETVRTHIQHVYAKMQINSREAMFARLNWFLV